MNHRPILTRVLFLLLPVALAGLVGSWLWNRRDLKTLPIRNVVLISIDTCRADHLSCYGFPGSTTPNIDAVAAEGVLFEQVISPIPLTLPAHASMLTGTIPPTHGVRDNFDYRLGDSQVTLTETLKENGFSTGAIIGAFPLDSQFGLSQGFDTYQDQFQEAHLAINISERKGEEVSRLAREFLGDHSSDPFFLFLHYFDPHAEYLPPEPYASTFAESPYAGEIAYVDHCIGEVVDRLKELELYDSTLLMIVGDHGEMLGEHGEIGHGYFVYQSALRVPMIIRLPGQHQPRRIQALAGLIDIVPTVCALLDIDPPAHVQGTNLASQWESKPQQRPADRALYCESPTPAKYGANPLQGLVTPRWKYIETTRPELYDLEADPEEAIDLAARQPQVVNEFYEALTSLLKRQTREGDADGQLQMDAATVAQLRGLGYVGGSAGDLSGMNPDKADPKDLIQFHVTQQHVVSLIAARNYREATPLLHQLIKEQPTVPSLHRNLAQIAMAQGLFSDAEAHLNRALALAPDNAETHNNLGAALGSQRRFDEAITHFREALRIQPDYPEALGNWAGVLAGQGLHDEAAVQYRRALELQPDYLKCHIGLGTVLIGQGKTAEAIDLFRHALRNQPDSSDLHFRLGQVLLQTGEFDAALTHTREAVRLQPDQPSYLHHLSWMLTAHPDPASRDAGQAVAHSRRAAELTQFRDPAVLDGLAAAYATAREFDRAIETAQSALALTTGDPDGAVATRIRERLAFYQKAGGGYQK